MNTVGNVRYQVLRCVALAITCSLMILPRALAQNAGNDAVYNSIGSIKPSTAFIDASTLIGSGLGSDICDAIYGLLSGRTGFPPYPSTGAVIDARGISGSNLTCIHGTPWYEGGVSVSPPSTILLPATFGASLATPIIISTPWVIPSNNHLIGEGEGDGPLSSGTTIQVSSSFNTTPGYIMQLGVSSGASGISIERLTIDGLGNSVNGISNPYAGPNTYVDHVSLYQIRGVGLLVENNADGSGPYSNVSFDTGAYSGTSSTACAQILSVTSLSNSMVSGGTRGIHGLDCHSETNDAPAAVLLDSSNNTIEDVTIIGFYDGILVGSNEPAQSNVLINIIGDTTHASATPINALHISNNHAATGDLAVIGVSNSSQAGTYTIQDDFTSTHLLDTYVGIYALGEAQGNGYPRFTTSPNAATWASGSSAPSGACTALGSLFSNTGSSGAALSVCRASGTWAAVSTY